jgi:hypothetical protein
MAAGRTTSYVVSGTKSIGGYSIASGYAKARSTFGGQASSTETPTICTARWSNGVTISWRRTLPSQNWAKACVKFSSARIGKPTIAAATWRTNKGLRVGARGTRIKSLYPSATSKRSGPYAVWTLQKASKTTLQAWVKKGKIAFFRLTKS